MLNKSGSIIILMIIIVSSFCFAIPLLIILLFPRYFADKWCISLVSGFCGVGDASVGFKVISLSVSFHARLSSLVSSDSWSVTSPPLEASPSSASCPGGCWVRAELSSSSPLSLPTLAAGWKLSQRGRTQLWHLLEALIQITLQHWICTHSTSGWAPRSKLHEAVWTAFSSASSSTVRSNLNTGLSLVSLSHCPGPDSTSSFNLLDISSSSCDWSQYRSLTL